MKTIEETLRDADPVRREPPPDAGGRDRIRRAVLATPPAAASRGASTRFTRRSFVTGIAGAMIALAVAGARLWPGGAALQAAVRFEVRLAEAQFAPGLREARVAGSNRVLYLHPEAVVTNDDIARSDVVRGETGFGVSVTFTAGGAEKMRRATAGHLGAVFAILIDGEVISAPTLRAPISTAAVISGDFTQAEAERIANGMRIR